MNHLRHLLLLAAAAAVLASCASAGAPSSASDSPSAEPSASDAGSATPSSQAHTGRPPAPSGIPDDVWHAVLADLGTRLGEPMTDLSVVSAETKTWNDGSLGCAVAGQMYTQALVDGYQIVVEVAGQRYDFRSGGGTDVRLCEGLTEGTKGG